MSQSTFIPLTDQGLIRASGEEATSFLHNLLTNDINHLPADGARHAALCTAKGRMIASFLIWREGQDILLMLSADILPGILKKLSMYILRSKVRLTDISAERTLFGVLGSEIGPTEPMSTAQWHGGTAIRLDAGRAILALPAGAPVPADGRLGEIAAWHLAEIRAGIPRIVAATQELFTPQMVNYELAKIGGVSFQKGCYPGQEIVARTQYLGKVKRRMYRVRLNEPFPPGTEVFTPAAGDQHCGNVVLCAPSPDGGFEALLVVQSSGAQSDGVYVGKPDGARATLLDLPYPID
ncbi:YgfZ/GcvT domain-containing protein [Sulfuricystis multivorans]|uniref:CAF17-like 4Fe-4S cluster assembly/insertion protein YgfZ n=1 Tax=Sulfuricystis multivorans TaxID=2211108 RepID=UPI000F83DF81|nr:folate-binding protein YgfZ [Sulfuricystis multivorans]